MVTTVTGVERQRSRPYVAVLGAPDDAVVLPLHLLSAMPDDGTSVVSGPAGVEVPFTADDPVAVFVWLSGATDVLRVDGPDLTPRSPSRLVH